MDNSKVDISKPVFALFTSLSNHVYVTLYGPSKRVRMRYKGCLVTG